MSTVTPIIDPDRGFRIWNISEIYTGPGGTGRYVPNIDDAVWDWGRGIYRVIAVDVGRTNLSQLRSSNIGMLGVGENGDNTSVVTGPGVNSNSFRVYIDTEVVPHVMAIDSSLYFKGSQNAYIKVFKGVDISETTGVVISAILTNNGNITSENIPLEAVIVPNAVNVSLKTPQLGFSTEALETGDIVTVVTYTTAGVKTSVDKFTVINTNYIRSINQTDRYVTNIEVISNLLSKTDNRLIECPVNLLTQSLNLRAKITYDNGVSVTLPIDGSRVSLNGLSQFVATQPGQSQNLVLTYNLGPDELAVDATPTRKVTRSYRIKTVEIDTFYSIKLYAVPVWQPGNQRYTLTWWLYNLDRDERQDVTNFVTLATNQPAFVGDRYNMAQNLTASFNMQSLGVGYSYYQYVQPITITLLRPGNTISPVAYFDIRYKPELSYGNGVRALYSADDLNPGKLKLNVGSTYTDAATWLTNLYRAVDPLYLTTSEAQAPNPTHARVIIGAASGGWMREVVIDDITKDIRNVNVTITQGASVRVELIRRSGSQDQQLAVLPFIATAML